MLGHLAVFGNSLNKFRKVIGGKNLKVTLMGYPYTIPEGCTGIVILDNDESRDYYPEAIRVTKASKLPCAVVKDYKVGSVFPTLLMMGVLDLSSITGTTKISLDTIGEGENAFVVPIDPEVVGEIATNYISVQQLVFSRVMCSDISLGAVCPDFLCSLASPRTW